MAVLTLNTENTEDEIMYLVAENDKFACENIRCCNDNNITVTN